MYRYIIIIFKYLVKWDHKFHKNVKTKNRLFSILIDRYKYVGI